MAVLVLGEEPIQLFVAVLMLGEDLNYTVVCGCVGAWGGP